MLITSSYNSQTKKMQVKDFSNKIAKLIADSQKEGSSIIFATKSLSRIIEFVMQIDYVLSEVKSADGYKFFIPDSLKYRQFDAGNTWRSCEV